MLLWRPIPLSSSAKTLCAVGCVCALLSGAFWALAWHLVPASYYDYDESDYQHAARSGWWANATDTPTQPILSFLEMGWRQYRNPIPSTELSAIARQQNDLNFYRHRHGPVHVYWLLLTQPWAPDEQTMRRLSLAVAPLAALAMALAFARLWPAPTGLLAGLLIAAFVLLSPITFPIVELAPHLLYTGFSGLALILLSRFAIEGRRGLWYASVVGSAFAFCTLEISFVLILTQLAVLVWRWRTCERPMALAGKSVLLFFGTILVLWPAAVLRLSALKAYLFMAYLAVARRSAWGEETLAVLWGARLLWTPVEWLMFLGALYFWWRHRRDPQWQALAPFLLYTVLMIGATLRVTSNLPRYVILFFSAVQLFTALAWAMWLRPYASRQRAVALSLIALVLSANAWAYRMNRQIGPPPRRVPSLVEQLRKQGLEGKQLLVPQEEIPTLHYYLPSAKLRGYLESEDPQARAASGRFDAIVLRGDPVLIRAPLKE